MEVFVMRKSVFAVALLLVTAATVFAVDRCVVLEDAYAEY
jgi:hypothetical protein